MLNTAIRIFLITLICFVYGCAVSTIATPEQEDRLTGLISSDQLKTGTAILSNTSKQKLAIVYSVNVPKSIQANDTLLSRAGSTWMKLLTMTNNSEADASIILSSDRLLQAVIAPLRERFQTVVVAKDLREAFTNGADVAALLDLRLAYTWDGDSTTPVMKYTHTANASYLFINRRLEQGPDLVANVTHLQNTPATGAEANNRDFLVNVRDARLKMLRQLEQEASQKLLK